MAGVHHHEHHHDEHHHHHGHHHQHEHGKPILAVDLDEVLADTINALCHFHNDRYGTSLKRSDFLTYHFQDTWGGTLEEAIQKVRDFYASSYFENVQPVEGSIEVLKELAKEYRIVIVSARQDVIRAQTQAFLDKYYSGLIEKVYLCNHYLSQAEQDAGVVLRKKSEICIELQATALIDDSLTTAKECAEHGIPVILFDYNGEYKWNKTSEELDPLITRVTDWHYILQNHDRLFSHNRFDKMSTSYDERPEVIKTAGEFTQLIRKLVPLNREMDVLEFGCGTGLVSLAIAPHVKSLVALDASEGMVSVVRRKIAEAKDPAAVASIQPRCLVVEKPSDLGGARFDLIISSLVMHHVPNVKQTIALLASLLKPGGVLLIADLMFEEDKTEFFHQHKGQAEHAGFNLEDAAAWARAAELADVEAKVFSSIAKKPHNRDHVVEFKLFYLFARATYPPHGNEFPSVEQADDEEDPSPNAKRTKLSN